MKLYEIVSELDRLEKEKEEITKVFKKNSAELEKKICDLRALENNGSNGFDVEKIQLARNAIMVSGNPYGKTSEVTKFGYKTIAEQAIIDIANGCKHLKTRYFGNKTYAGFYQQENHEYGYGPKHGSIVDKVILKIRNRELTDDEKDACIYYLKNYVGIAKAEGAE